MLGGLPRIDLPLRERPVVIFRSVDDDCQRSIGAAIDDDPPARSSLCSGKDSSLPTVFHQVKSGDGVRSRTQPA